MLKQDFIEQAMKRYSRVGETKSRYWAEGLWQMLTDKSVDEIPDDAWPWSLSCALWFDLPLAVGVELDRIKELDRAP